MLQTTNQVSYSQRKIVQGTFTMKKVFSVFIILLMLIGCSTKKERFEFYSGHVKILVPRGWKLLSDNSVKQIESPDGRVVLSFTLFNLSSSSHSNFEKDRFNMVDKTLWKEIRLKLNFRSRYTLSYKTYIDKKKRNYYIVIPISNNHTYLSFTYVIDINSYDQYKHDLAEIIRQIKIK
jgi:hypothetical protein